MIIYRLCHALRWALVSNPAILHEDDAIGTNSQGVFNTVFNQEDTYPFICQTAEQSKRFLCAGRIEACQWLIQQQHGRAHRQHPGQSDFLFLTPGEMEGLPITQMGNAQIAERLIHPLTNLSAWQTQILQPKSHLSKNMGPQNLAVGILQHRSHTLRDMRQAHF
ncbi:MAG: hypothetical protein BWY63_00182 [Chloroflexi bacterium ADurb.Bin360]|nr:MAG: hypothetical protein BWY63_00182 [Chloroflexi bacterium ADurb.Bin360]